MYGRAESMPTAPALPSWYPSSGARGGIWIYRQGQEHRRSRCSQFCRRRRRMRVARDRSDPVPEPQAGPLTFSPSAAIRRGEKLHFPRGKARRWWRCDPPVLLRPGKTWRFSRSVRGWCGTWHMFPGKLLADHSSF